MRDSPALCRRILAEGKETFVTSTVIRDHVLSAVPAEFRMLTELGRSVGRLVSVVDRT